MSRLILAPMEGLTDFAMRAVLTRISPYDWCVSEFLRITDRLLPPRTLLVHVPEMADGWRTVAGTPVHLQLLGSDPVAMAENAAQAAELGVPAIDLNFGCPAKTVNRHGGGAALLAEPDRLFQIVDAVRRAVPREVPVSAKMRLGLADDSPLLRNAEAIHDAGADWLTVHARTKAQGYGPPVRWEALQCVRQRWPDWTVIANGDVRDVESWQRCRRLSGCEDVMIGRAAVQQPDLVACLKDPEHVPMTWADVDAWQQIFLGSMSGSPGGIIGRYKQWLGMTCAVYPEAVQRFSAVKRCKDMAALQAAMTVGDQPS